MMTTMTNQYEFYKQPRLHNPLLVISWLTYDVASAGNKTAQFLINALKMEEIGEINPLTYSTFEGAVFRDNLIQVPKCKFWASEEKNLVLLESDEPFYERFNFLNLLLDISVEKLQAQQIFTISAYPALMAHTHPRRIQAVFSCEELKEEYSSYEKLVNMTWKGQPAISTYLLWAAVQRELSCISLWPEVPFYLGATEDQSAVKTTLSFLSQCFHLNLDLSELDNKIQKKNEALAQLREEDPQVEEYITQLEGGYTLNENEQMELTKKVYDYMINKD